MVIEVLQSSPSPSVQRCDETVNMDEFVAFSHSFWRFVLSIGTPERSGSQSFHESSVQCSIIQSASTLEMATTGWEAREMDAGERPLVYCRSDVVDVLVSQVGLRTAQVSGQDAWQELEWLLMSCPTYTSCSLALCLSWGVLSPWKLHAYWHCD